MSQDPIPTPPTPRRELTETKLHGVALADDYAWLREKDSPEVKAYLEAENAYAEAVMAPLEGLREELYGEMLSHLKQTDVSVPFRDRGWWYYTRTEEGLQYGIHCRKPDGGEPAIRQETPEEVVLNGNELATGHAFFSIGAMEISDNGRWLAYTTDTKGFRQYTLHIRDLETGIDLPGTVERVGSVAWAQDDRTLFYTVEDEEQKRQFQLWRHVFGSDHATDHLAFEDKDERFNVAVGRTRDGKFLVLESASHVTTECWFLPADQPLANFRMICPRENEHEYSIDHRNGVWFIRTNDRGRNFRLVTAPVDRPERANWTERIAHRDRVMLEDVDLFQGFFFACEREAGLPRLRQWSFPGNGPEAVKTADIAFPEPTYNAHPHVNRMFETTRYRYGYQSLVTPGSVYEYDVVTGASQLLKRVEIPGALTRDFTPVSGCRLRPATELRSPCRWSIAGTNLSGEKIRSTSMATALTVIPCRSASIPTG